MQEQEAQEGSGSDEPPSGALTWHDTRALSENRVDWAEKNARYPRDDKGRPRRDAGSHALSRDFSGAARVVHLTRTTTRVTKSSN